MTSIFRSFKQLRGVRRASRRVPVSWAAGLLSESVGTRKHMGREATDICGDSVALQPLWQRLCPGCVGVGWPFVG